MKVHLRAKPPIRSVMVDRIEHMHWEHDESVTKEMFR